MPQIDLALSRPAFVRITRAGPSHAPPLSQESEHRDDSERLQRLAWVLTNILGDRDVPRRALDEVARDFIEHARHQIDFEERVLFPAAMKALRPEDWAEIEAQVGAPLFF